MNTIQALGMSGSLVKACCNASRIWPVSQLAYHRTLLTKCVGDPEFTVPAARDQLRSIVGSPRIWGEARDQTIARIQLAVNQNELPSKTMMDSYREASIPLGKDNTIRGNYVNHFGSVRYGKIMEDLDTMAVWIGYTHNMECQGSKSPLSIVTAMVDSITVDPEPLTSNKDIVIRGHVTWVGKTSMEIAMEVEQEAEDKTWKKNMDAKFLMVARDPGNKCKAFVCPLTVDTAEEKSLFDAATAAQSERRAEADQSLLRNPPSEAERLVIHDLFLSSIDQKAATFKKPIKPPNSAWMDETLLKNIIICFPEQRNLYNKIFGGFLMRQGYELAWANACVYTQQRPQIVAVDDFLFQAPVEIGSLLYLSSQVVFTQGDKLQVRVHAEVVDPATNKHKTTNVFHYTFATWNDGPGLKQIVPKSYAEYMMYLDGKRHFEAAMK